jgi:molybdopterin/thiamine biosynthesis adenylyltransferase
MSAGDVYDVLNFAIANNYLQYESARVDSALSGRAAQKWDRQLKYLSEAVGGDMQVACEMQRRLLESHVLQIGVGGVGGYMALTLAMVGVGKMTLVDHDLIELSNTSRQVLYTEAEVGTAKVDIAKAEILRRNPSMVVNAVECLIDSEEKMQEVIRETQTKLGHISLVILNADTPRGRICHWVDGAAGKSRVPSMYVYPHGGTKVTVGPLVIPGRTKSYAEMIPESAGDFWDPEVAEINARFEANIMDPYNGLAAKMGAVEALKFLTGITPPFVLEKTITVDTQDWTLDSHDL